MTLKDFKLGFVRIRPYCETHSTKLVVKPNGYFFCSEQHFEPTDDYCVISLTCYQYDSQNGKNQDGKSDS